MNHRLLVALIAAMASSMMAHAQDWAQFERYREQNSQLSGKPHAVFMGDSITDNWVSVDSGFFTSNNYAGRGISGQTTSQMLVRFRRDVLDLAPEYVVILAGTNDIARNNGYISLENIAGNIISMCELARLAGVRPVLCSVLPASRYGWRPEVKPAGEIVALNEMIRAYAAANEIPYVDYHSVLKDEHGGLPKKYADDGVHPNMECYSIMERIIVEFLNPDRQ